MGMRDLGTLGGTNSEANGVNDAGQVVGYSHTVEGATYAFITGPNGAGMRDLNSLVDLPPGVILTEAIDINNAGQIIALSVIPEPEIYVLILAGLALIGLIPRRKKMNAEPLGWLDVLVASSTTTKPPARRNCWKLSL